MKPITRTITILAFLTSFLIFSSPTKVLAASCTWDGTVGNWDVKERWDCNEVPDQDDDVYISSGTVNLAESASVKSLTLSGTGTLTGDGNLTADTVTWTGGTMSGSGSTTATTEANITGFNYLVLIDRTFNNVGNATLNWPGGTGFLYLHSAATEFNNLGTFTIQSSNLLRVVGGPGTFNNEGRVIMDVPEGTIQIGANFVNASTGIIEVASGTLQIVNGTATTTNSGGYHVLADATLYLGGVGHSLTGNIVATGGGTLEIVTGVSLDGTFTFPDGILNLPGNGIMTLSTASTTANVGTLNLSGGKLIGPGDLTANTVNWSAGEMSGGGSTTATAAFNFTGSAMLTLGSHTLNNSGNAIWDRTGYLNMQTTASEFNNQVGATFTIQNSVLNFMVGNGVINNAGKLTKSGPVTDVQITGRFVNAATGIVEVEAGKLVINNNSNDTPASSGAYHIHTGATLRLNGNPHDLSGDFAVTEQGTIEAAATVNLDGTLTFPGAIALLSGGTLNLSTDATTVNVAILDLSLGILTGPGDLTAGTINWSAGTMSGSGSTTASSAANFTGTGNITLNDRTFNNAGAATWNRTGASYLYFQTAASVFNNQSGATFSVQSSGPDITYGNGVFNNAGTLNLTTGEFNIHTFTQSSGGITNLTISGVTPFTNYSRLVTTHADLAGELNVTFTGGYTPQVGDRYILLTYSSTRSGDYSPVHIPAVDDIIWLRYYQGNSLNLWAAGYQINIPNVVK